MNMPGKFRKYEDENVRRDENEALDQIYQPAVIKNIKIADTNLRVLSPVKIDDQNHHDKRLFCMYAITNDFPKKFVIDSKNSDLGQKCLFITNVKEFFSKVDCYFKKNKIKYTYRLVHYLNFSEYSGQLNLFCKSHTYEYQKEFRIIAHSIQGFKPLKIKIGKITAISKILDTNCVVGKKIIINSP